MAANLFDTMNVLSILLGGRRPEWNRQFDLAYPNGMPTAGDGQALRDAPRTQLLVDMREEVRHRMARIAIRVVDLTGIYRTVVNGNVTAFDAAAAGAAAPIDVLTGWRDDINADVVVNLIVVASLEDSDDDGVDDVLVLRGVDEADYSISVNVTGTAELDLLADPTSSDVRIYLTDKPPKASGVAAPNAAATGFRGTLGSGDWRQPNGAQYSIGVRGFSDFFDTAGYDRFYAELYNIVSPGGDGALAPHTFTLTPRITVGPSILE